MERQVFLKAPSAALVAAPRNTVTVLRQNRRVLPEPRKEDDFPEATPVRVKPACDPLRYSPPGTAQGEQTMALESGDE
jgi:hypothetical protein